MSAPVLDPFPMVVWPSLFGPSIRLALAWASRHSGLPVIVVAAIAVVVSWRIFKRTMRFTVEVVAVVVLLLLATRLGWIAW